MNKKETTNPKELKNQNYEAKKMNTSSNLKKKKDKNLPWWVELLFVQIGLPDKLLIKILKAKKTSKEFIKNEKKSILIFLFVITTLASVSYTHLRAHETVLDLVCRLLLEKKKSLGL